MRPQYCGGAAPTHSAPQAQQRKRTGDATAARLVEWLVVFDERREVVRARLHEVHKLRAQRHVVSVRAVQLLARGALARARRERARARLARKQRPVRTKKQLPSASTSRTRRPSAASCARSAARSASLLSGSRLRCGGGARSARLRDCAPRGAREAHPLRGGLLVLALRLACLRRAAASARAHQGWRDAVRSAPGAPPPRPPPGLLHPLCRRAHRQKDKALAALGRRAAWQPARVVRSPGVLRFSLRTRLPARSTWQSGGHLFSCSLDSTRLSKSPLRPAPSQSRQDDERRGCGAARAASSSCGAPGAASRRARLRPRVGARPAPAARRAPRSGPALARRGC
jgi:hypothetical protein